MIKLIQTRDAWNTPAFAQILKQELKALDQDLLPLQAGLSHSSHVSGTEISPVVLSSRIEGDTIISTVGIFYGGINTDSCCTDDPTPLCEENEYCEVELTIDRNTAQTDVRLL